MANEQNTGFNSDNVTTHGGYFAGTMNFNSLLPEDDTSSNLNCPFCGQTADKDSIQENGKIICKKCSGDFFEFKQFKKNVTKHQNVPPENQNDYDNIIFHIILKLQSGKYPEADALCDKAITLCSQSPQGLEYKALCLYFTMPKKEIISTSAREILAHLNSAQEVDTTSKNYQNIAPSIAFKYFRVLKYRIQNIS